MTGHDYLSDTDKIYKDGLSSVAIPLKTLFTTCRSVSNCLKQPIGSVEDVIIILTLDKPLLSEIQGDKLNPMTLTVGSATQMPDNGMSFEDLDTRYVFLIFKFLVLMMNIFVPFVFLLVVIKS